MSLSKERAIKNSPDAALALIDRQQNKIKEQSLEIASLNARNAMLSLDRSELAEHLSEAGRMIVSLDFRTAIALGNKYEAVVERVME